MAARAHVRRMVERMGRQPRGYPSRVTRVAAQGSKSIQGRHLNATVTREVGRLAIYKEIKEIE